ncbi:MAG: hypothetical protein IIZ35_05440 [Clostridia bacterium]|nr:hypothetical protein [Clostridia bacterium]
MTAKTAATNKKNSTSAEKTDVHRKKRTNEEGVLPSFWGEHLLRRSGTGTHPAAIPIKRIKSRTAPNAIPDRKKMSTARS